MSKSNQRKTAIFKLESDGWKYLLFLVLSFSVYGNSINHSFNLDDNYVLSNVPEKVASFKATFEVFQTSFDRVDYRPIPILSYALQKYYFGDIEAKTSHIINIILFFFGVCFLYKMLVLLLKDKQKSGHLIAFCACLLFIAHPIHSNVVCSIKNRDILISFIFAILSFTAYLNFFRHRKKHNIALAFIFILLALLSKLDAIWVMLLIPAHYVLEYNKDEKISFKIVYRVLAILVLMIVVLWIRELLSGLATDMIVDENPILFTENPIINTGIRGKLFYGMVSFFYYLKFMLIPFGYYFYFGYNVITEIHFLHPYFILGLIFFVGYIYNIYKFYKTNKTVCFALIFYLISIFFFLNIFRPLAGVVAPRLGFHASAAFCLILALWISQLSKSTLILNVTYGNTFVNQYSKRLIVLITVLFLIMASFTINRNKDWKDMISLMDADLPNLKDSFQANRIGSAIYLSEIEKSNLTNNNINVKELAEKGLLASARASRIDNNNIFVNEGIGIAHLILGNEDQALDQFNSVIEKFDTSFVAWDFSGDILNSRNDFRSAINCYSNAIRVSFQEPDVYYKLSNTFIKSGNIDEGISFFKKKTEEHPNWYLPYLNIGQIYLADNNLYDASFYFSKAFELGYKNQKEFNLLKTYLITNGHLEEAKILEGNYYKKDK